ncbi:hypothetical protein DPSP01_012535 [Paraphaeosphaeria sporulosa]|uniref:Uncharacterized protein n=1 Tax=Paraphaeosphaeria sporulosa TaxID=1460663 RepID=A0A177BV62_9PLEO|nr:uncharacterized protein CC84DRAFT_1223040 [Paraphaeosphaeria sporulosa]OAF99363.1 hypothetical protein CC84DRAFT_1223040 [Paraphaeosphaeria sporulosa]
MAIFSRTKRASKAVEEPKIAPLIEPARLPPPPPAISAPIPPIDPTKPAYTESPPLMTTEEVRERIAANRKRQSDIIRRSAALSYTQTHTHSRTVSEYSLPGSGWQTHRIREPTSIEAILQDMPIYNAKLVPPPLVVRGAELSRRHSEEFHAYSNPRAVPLPPPIKTQLLPPPRSRSRRLTKTKPSSPLSEVPIPPEEEYFSSSSRDSSRNSASTANSDASSATSASSVFNEQTEAKQTLARIPNFSKPTKTSKKEKPALEISLPYSCNVDNPVEEVKTAKSIIPTWRYEDLNTDTQLPTPVTTISAAHMRNQSWGHSRKTSFGTMFRRKNASTSAF